MGLSEVPFVPARFLFHERPEHRGHASPLYPSSIMTPVLLPSPFSSRRSETKHLFSPTPVRKPAGPGVPQWVAPAHTYCTATAAAAAPPRAWTEPTGPRNGSVEVQFYWWFSAGPSPGALRLVGPSSSLSRNEHHRQQSVSASDRDKPGIASPNTLARQLAVCASEKQNSSKTPAAGAIHRQINSRIQPSQPASHRSALPGASSRFVSSLLFAPCAAVVPEKEKRRTTRREKLLGPSTAVCPRQLISALLFVACGCCHALGGCRMDGWMDGWIRPVHLIYLLLRRSIVVDLSASSVQRWSKLN
ncbi:hypothetical protein IWX90DRAFT_137143 [Phyllosticta citrichinensis]|uniref:Uncharacterized protein n=1 Tax=Phyllosticta citrichinensis TaxID=1130410 RepID=A0ABR1XY84_9PEZI